MIGNYEMCSLIIPKLFFRMGIWDTIHTKWCPIAWNYWWTEMIGDLDFIVNFGSI